MQCRAWQTPAEVASVIDALGVTYLLLTKDASDDALEKFTASYPGRISLRWQNDRMTLYKVLR
jgi:hypothetical protein